MPNSFPRMKLDNSIKAALFLFVFTLIIYSNSLGGEFVYDDDYFIVKNTHIRNLGNIPSFFVNPSTTAFAELAQDVYRPLTTISYAFDYRFWRLDTFGYHLENVLLHALNAILVFILLQLIFGNIFIAFLSSLLFACHPVQTEAVAWISGRSSMLFLFFYLASFILYLLFMKRRKKAYLALSLILFSGSLFSKEMAVSLPLLLVLYDIHFAPPESLKKRALKLAPYFLLAAFFIIARYIVLNNVSQCGWWGGSPYHTLLTMLVTLGEYVKLMVAPVKLCAFYVTTVYTSVASAKVFLSAAAIVILIASLPFIFRRSRRTSFAICFFFAALLPVSNIVPLKALMAERFLYLPSIGFCILVSILLEKIARKEHGLIKLDSRKLAIVMASALVLLYSARTMMRNEDWKSQVAITESILKISPLNQWALTTLGAAYSDLGQYETAIKPLVKAIILSEDYFAPRNVLGFCYLELGRYDEAISILTDALKIKPYNLEGLSSLGVAYAKTKRYPEAIEQFERAIKADPSFANGYMNLATTYDQMGESGRAIEVYKQAASSTGSSESMAIAYVRIGDVYRKLNDLENARAYYEKANALCDPKMVELKKLIADRLKDGRKE